MGKSKCKREASKFEIWWKECDAKMSDGESDVVWPEGRGRGGIFIHEFELAVSSLRSVVVT